MHRIGSPPGREERSLPVGSLSRHPGVAMVLVAICLPLAALCAEPPSLKPGMWEFKRTVEGQGEGGRPLTLTRKECADPTADMRKMNETLSKQGCTFSPPVRQGDTYRFSSKCRIQGVPIESHSVITVEGGGAYTVEVTSSGGGKTTKELLIAKRVGDC